MRGLMSDMKPLPSWDSEATWATFENGTFHGLIAGVEIQKSADDLDRYEEIIEISQPDLVIETGTRRGGSALWFQSKGLQVVTIDLAADAGRDAQATQHGWDIHYLTGYSSIRLPAEMVRTLTNLVEGKRVMVSLDSDHHSAHVQAEISTWAGWVTPGCYLVVEDACFDMWEPDRARVGGAKIPEYGGPLHALNASGIEHSKGMFWRDTAVEGLTPVSHSPVGWWRRCD